MRSGPVPAAHLVEVVLVRLAPVDGVVGILLAVGLLIGLLLITAGCGPPN